MHIVCSIIFGMFPLMMYPIMMGVVFVALMFVIYVIAPFADWFFDLFEPKEK